MTVIGQKLNIWTGELLDFSKEELEAIRLRALNVAYFNLGDEAERAVQRKLMPQFPATGGRLGASEHREFLLARHDAMLAVAQEALAKQEAEAAAAEAAKPTPDELARARVLRIHGRKLQARL